MNRIIENNQAVINGEIASDFRYSHELYGEGFYLVDVKISRLSNSYDVIPVMVSERLIDVNNSMVGLIVNIEGEFRSYNRHEERKNKLVLSVFAREFSIVDELAASAEANQIYLDGFICKEPVYRKTPLGREVTDLLLAINRPYGKSDYIPCICWGRNARYASGFNVGDRCVVQGRIQSREYTKKLEDGSEEVRVAYEVSIAKVEVVTNEK